MSGKPSLSADVSPLTLCDNTHNLLPRERCAAPLPHRHSSSMPVPDPSSPYTEDADRLGAVRLDPEALARLHALDPHGGQRLMERAAEAFETLVDRVLPRWDAALDSGDLATIAPLAHTLKSAAGALGALALADDCAMIESLLRHGRQDGVLERARRLRRDLPGVRAAVQALAGTRTPAACLS